MENSEGDIQDFFQRDEPQNNEVDGAVTHPTVPTNPNSHVRFNPDIVSYASCQSPQITGIDFAENFQDDENIQIQDDKRLNNRSTYVAALPE